VEEKEFGKVEDKLAREYEEEEKEVEINTKKLRQCTISFD
jgi:hypothetical protein